MPTFYSYATIGISGPDPIVPAASKVMADAGGIGVNGSVTPTLALSNVTVAGGGTYKTANLIPANVGDGVLYGVDEVGTLVSDPPPAPDAPVILAVSYGRGRIKIYISMAPWTETFDVYRDGVLIDPAGIDITENSFIDENLADGEYDYKVVAKNTSGSTDSNTVLNVPSYLTDQEQNIWDTFQTIFASYMDVTEFDTVVYNHQDGLTPGSATGYPALLIYPVKVVSPVGAAAMSFRIAVHMKAWDTGSNQQTEFLVEQLEKVTTALADILASETGISVTRYADPKMASFQLNIIEAYQELTVNLVG